MNVVALVTFADLLVVGLPVADWATRRFAGLRIVGERAFWICYTAGSVALCTAGIATGFWAGVVMGGLGTVVGALLTWLHWDDDDDDWPGPRKLAEWAKRKLARRPVPIPVQR